LLLKQKLGDLAERNLFQLKRLPLVDLVRTFSILSVLAIHTDPFFLRPSKPWLAWAWNHFQRNGTYGVYAFFLVSGFLITGVIRRNPGGLWKPSLSHFYIQRAGRILPLLVLTVWIGILMLLTPRPPHASYIDIFHPESGTVGAGFWICLSTFTFNWFLAFQPLASFGMFWNLLWSLSVEEQFYFLFPLLLKHLNNEKNLFRFLIAVLGIGFGWRLLCAVARWNNRDLQIFTSLGAFDNVAFGVLLDLTIIHWGPTLSKKKIWAAFCCLTGLILVISIYLFTSMNDLWDRVYASTFFASGLFLFLLGGLQFRLGEWKWWEPLTWPGRYCYGGYLLHPMIFTVLFPILFEKDAWEAFFFFSVVTTALAAISFYFFEIPANRLIRKTFDKSPFLKF
jgi:peptidoglycan/LPS O-acetylase OafA/YrhL